MLSSFLGCTRSAHAYLQRDIFDEWEYNPPRTRPSSTARRRRPRSSSPLDHDEPGEEDPSSDDPFLDGPAAGRRRRGDGDNDEEEDEEADEEDGQGGEVFEISLSTMVEVLDVFGTAGVKTARQIEKEGDALDQDEEEAEGGAGAAGNRWKGKNRDRQREDKHQSALRMTYDGEGSPLVLLCVSSTLHSSARVHCPDESGVRVVIRTGSKNPAQSQGANFKHTKLHPNATFRSTMTTASSSSS